MSDWKKKIRGNAVIYTHAEVPEGRAIVVNIRGIFFNGDEYTTLTEAKANALASTHDSGKGGRESRSNHSTTSNGD